MDVAAQPVPKWIEALRWIGGLGMVTIALLRAMVMFTPDPYFDTDPVAVPVAFAGLGPMGSLWLDLALLVMAQLALAGDSLARRGVKVWMVLLALVPAAPIAVHGLSSVDDLWRGTTWLSAMVALVAVAHLARDAKLRAVMFAACIALIGPLIARGLLQVTVEHDQLMEDFRRNRLEFFAARGWEPESNNAKLYERRLMQVEATGWFGLANIYGSVMIPMLIAGVGLTWCAVKRRVSSGWIGVTVLIALAAAGGLVMSGSKGAVGAAVLGLALWVVGIFKYGRWRMLAIIALPLLTIVGIIVRGTLLPERFAGDLSLLFRWHYWIGAARMFAESPGLGVGPGSFQAAYALVKPLRNPEEVMSAHSVFIDWVATLGVIGASWIGLVFALLGRADRSVRAMTEGDEAAPLDLPKFAVFAMVGVFVVSGGVAIVIEMHSVDQFGLMARVIGLTAAIIIGAVTAGIALSAPRAIAWTALAAATGLLIHAQMEMTFFQPGSVVWACVLLGVAVSPAVGSDRAGTGRVIELAIGAGLILVLAIGVIRVALPVTKQFTKVREAAHLLHVVGEARLARRESPAVLREMEARARQDAASLLDEAAEIEPFNRRILIAQIGQLGARAALFEGEERRLALEFAYTIADSLARRTNDPAIVGLTATIAEELEPIAVIKRVLPDPLHWRKLMTQLDPFSVDAWRALGDVQWHVHGDVHWRANDREAAAASYARALELDDALDLDPLKKLDAEDRAELEARVRAGSGESSP